jgi:hypothetical protein
MADVVSFMLQVVHPCTHFTGGEVSHRTSLKIIEMRKLSCSSLQSNPRRPDDIIVVIPSKLSGLPSSIFPFIRVHRAVAWQWVYQTRYNTFP